MKKAVIGMVMAAGLCTGILYAGEGNESVPVKKNVYTGEVKITKNIVYYDRLTIDNARIRYPHFWTPVSFQVKKLTVNGGNGKIRFYGWKLVKIDSLDGNSSKIFADSGGSVYIRNIKNENLSNIVIGKYTPFVFLGFNTRNGGKTDISILLKENIDKRVVIENGGNRKLNVKCLGKGKGEIFYKGNPSYVSVKGNCVLYIAREPGKNTDKAGKTNHSGENYSKIFKAISSKGMEDVMDKYAWAPVKDVIYFVKYYKDKSGATVGVIFGVDLKTNRVIRDVPDSIAKATGYTRVVESQNGQKYYIYDKTPSSTEVIINHKKYIINAVAAQ